LAPLNLTVNIGKKMMSKTIDPLKKKMRRNSSKVSSHLTKTDQIVKFRINY